MHKTIKGKTKLIHSNKQQQTTTTELQTPDSRLVHTEYSHF